MRHLLSGSALAGALLLVACGQTAILPVDPLPPGAIEPGVEIVLDRETYRTIDPVQVQLTNRTGRNYGFNLCGRRFERRNGDAWVGTPEELRICTAHLDHLAAGGSASQQTDMALDLAPGTYRMRVGLYPLDGGIQRPSLIAVSAPFTIRP